MSNLSILEQNMCDALGGVVVSPSGDLLAFERPDLCDEMRKVFLRLKDRDVLKAERCAQELAILAPFLDHFLPIAAANFSGVAAHNTAEAVRAFIMERHVRRYFPNHAPKRNQSYGSAA